MGDRDSQGILPIFFSRTVQDLSVLNGDSLTLANKQEDTATGRVSDNSIIQALNSEGRGKGEKRGERGMRGRGGKCFRQKVLAHKAVVRFKCAEAASFI